DSSGHVFMDTENYEQISLSDDLVGEMMPFVKPNTVITVLLSEGKPVSFELPNVVELEITETAPGIKGATVTNQLKEAVCETGLKVRVPPFIEVGEKVRINTTDGTYNSRAWLTCSPGYTPSGRHTCLAAVRCGFRRARGGDTRHPRRRREAIRLLSPEPVSARG